MIRTTTLAATAALILGLSGAAFAQGAGTGTTGTGVGSNAAGSKSGVVGRGDGMDSPASTGTATSPATRPAPGTQGTVPTAPTPMPPAGGPPPAAR